tara:strand:- start:102 stop:500 length:399 start_codon:yes stop_codon:yes gene_type:complete
MYVPKIAITKPTYKIGEVISDNISLPNNGVSNGSKLQKTIMLTASVLVEAYIKKLKASPGATKPKTTPDLKLLKLNLCLKINKLIKMRIVPKNICAGTIKKGEKSFVMIFVTTIAPVHNIIEVICEIWAIIV